MVINDIPTVPTATVLERARIARDDLHGLDDQALAELAAVTLHEWEMVIQEMQIRGWVVEDEDGLVIPDPRADDAPHYPSMVMPDAAGKDQP